MKQISIRNTLIFTFCSTLFFFLLTMPVMAATTGNVSATITVKNIAITVTDGSVDYLTIGTSEYADTTTGTYGVDDSQLASNDSNVIADFNIMGADSTNWTLAGTPGSETFSHSFCTTDCDGSPSWTALTTSYQTLATSIAADTGEQTFDLKLETPTATTNYTQQSTTVTVQVVEN